MDRRDFLKTSGFLTVTVAAGGLVACGGGHSSAPRGTYAFNEGVASGDPRPDSVVLWTRVVRTDGLAQDIPLDVEVASDPAFANMIAQNTIDATQRFDNTVRNKVAGLAAGTVYYYRFRAANDTSPTGRTKTAPAAGAALSSLKFAFITCQDYSVNHWRALEALVGEDIDFVVHLGDYIYETVGIASEQGHVEPAHAALTLPDGFATPNIAGSASATTLRDYRYLYKSYRSDPRLQAVHARFPMIAVWDDHDFTDDCWQDHETYTNANLEQLDRRRNATQAWFENMPADVPFDPANPDFRNITIYRDFQFGSLAHLVMTDERLYRSDHVIDEMLVAPAQGLPANPGGNDQVGSRAFVDRATYNAVEAQKLAAGVPISMLGDVQENWWKDKMASSSATWKLWGNEVSLLRMQFDLRALAPAPFNKVFLFDCDQWDGYNVARKRLMGFLRDMQIRNVVGITGDIHAFFAGQVYDDYESANPQPVMVDIVTAGVSSASLFDGAYAQVQDPRFRALAPLVYSVDANGNVYNTLNATLRQFNPWLKAVDTQAIGYTLVTLTASNLVAQQKKFGEIGADGSVPAATPISVTTITIAVGSTALDVQTS